MSASKKQSVKSKVTTIGTAEAFYRLYRALPKRDRLKIARYIFEESDIRHSFDHSQIPNKTTLKSFAEDKSDMPEFHSVDELRKDLLS